MCDAGCSVEKNHAARKVASACRDAPRGDKDACIAYYDLYICRDIARILIFNFTMSLRQNFTPSVKQRITTVIVDSAYLCKDILESLESANIINYWKIVRKR